MVEKKVAITNTPAYKMLVQEVGKKEMQQYAKEKGAEFVTRLVTALEKKRMDENPRYIADIMTISNGITASLTLDHNIKKMESGYKKRVTV